MRSSFSEGAGCPRVSLTANEPLDLPIYRERFDLIIALILSI